MAAGALAVLMALLSTSPRLVVPALTACNSGCTTDTECGGNGATCCGGQCCGDTCCGDAQKGTCSKLQDNSNCGVCGNSCGEGSGGCVTILSPTCKQLPACGPDAGLELFPTCSYHANRFECVGL